MVISADYNSDKLLPVLKAEEGEKGGHHRAHNMYFKALIFAGKFTKAGKTLPPRCISAMDFHGVNPMRGKRCRDPDP